MTEHLIQTTGLVKTFGPTRALDGLDLTVSPGRSTASSDPTGRASPRPSGSCWA